MAAHDRIFGSDLPAVTDKIGEMIVVDGADGGNIFKFKDDLKQRLTLDHVMDDTLAQSDGGQDGRHRHVMMKESATAPIALENTGVVYTKEDGTGGDTELYYKDDATSGNEIQLTSEGEISKSDIYKEWAGIYSEFSFSTGTLLSSQWPYYVDPTTGFIFPTPYSATTISYPGSSWDKDNTVLIASSIMKTTSFLFQEVPYLYLMSVTSGYPYTQIGGTSYAPVITANTWDPVSSLQWEYEMFLGNVRVGSKISFGTSLITITASPLYSSGTYKVILGKLK